MKSVIKKIGKKVEKEIVSRLKNEKAKRIREFRRIASQKASMANKRIKRLEKSGLTNSPAYKQYIKSGGAKFGVRGKTFNEVQAEVSRLNNFLNSETSTIRGYNATLKEMANNIGVKYTNLKELRKKSDRFFELASKVEQYLRNVDDIASAIGYQKIWESINQYTKQAKIDLSDSKNDIDSMVKNVIDAIKEQDAFMGDGNKALNMNWFPLKD